jgi:hypothetical protein
MHAAQPTGLRPAALPRVLLLVLPLSLFACKAGSSAAPTRDAGDAAAPATSASPQTPCSPLAAPPITLGTIIGVAKDASGVLYVDSSNGVFVSGGDTLNRQVVTGAGQSGSSDFLYTFDSPGDDGGAARNLIVVETGGLATAMSLGPPGSKSFVGGTPLTLVAPSTVSGMAIENTPNLIDYLADVSNGDVLLTTTPMNEDATSDNGGLAVFYGSPAAVAQRTITAFEQTISNDGTMTFLVDGTPYTLAFGTVTGPDSGPLGVFTLQGLTPKGGAPLTVTLRSPTPTTLPSGLSFTCSP